jgi:hypothetical protein
MGWQPANDIGSPIGAPLGNADGVKGYAFDDQGTQHVIYEDFNQANGGEGHVHELWWGMGDATHHNDLTDRTGAPLADGGESAYVFTLEETQHVTYVGRDQHVYEIWWQDGDPQLNKLSERAGAPLAAGGPPASYAFEAEGTQHVFYLAERTATEDRHIEEIWWESGSTPNHGSLKPPTTGSRPASTPSAYVFKGQGSQHVVYRGEDGHVHHFGWRGEVTNHEDLNDAAKEAVRASGRPIGYVFDGQGTQHVVYVGEDKHIHELWWDPSGWHPNDLTKATGAPLASITGTPAGYVFDAEGTQHVVYVGEDKHIHELWWDPSGWHWNDLTMATQAPPGLSDPSGYVFPREGTQHVLYSGEDHHVIELYWLP